MFRINLSTHPLTVPSVMCVSILLSRLKELRLIYSFGCCLIQVNFAGLALFLSDTSPIIVYPCHSLHWLTHSLVLLRLDWCDPGVWRYQLKTCWCCYSCLHLWWGTCWQLCGYDSDAEDCSRYRGWNLVKILKLRLSWYFETEVWSRFWSWGSVDILKPKFGQDFEAEVWSRLCGSRLFNILRLKFGQDSEGEVGSRFWRWSWVKILRLHFDQLVT